ncbi:hypothetical protein Tco_0518216 [Tanacetum coccineum]
MRSGILSLIRVMMLEDHGTHCGGEVTTTLGNPNTHYYLNPEHSKELPIMELYKENPDTEPVIDIQRQWHQARIEIYISYVTYDNTLGDSAIVSKQSQRPLSPTTITTRTRRYNTHIPIPFRDTIFKPLTLLLPAPTPIQSSILEALPQHPEATVTSEDDPTQITPNQPIDPISPTAPNNQVPTVLSSNKPPAEESTPPTEQKASLVQKEEI